jgi:GH24 family phage-related lysozyme (muramidase)
MVSNISKEGINLIAYYECAGKPNDPKWLTAYKDSGGVWTCGIGTIRYPNGQPVVQGDTITPEQRDEYFLFEIREKVARVNFLTRDDITQQQFDSLVSFSYNIGTIGLQKSTLLKTLNNNLTDTKIITNFLAWRYDNGKEVSGLTRRRMSEAYFYFTGQLKTNWINYKTYSQATINEVLKEIAL